jgi:molybdopterin-guanine dinucleotide biosynthesis protein B
LTSRLHILGRKNSGKTTLIAELVQRMSRDGYRIGTIKHTHHDHELDTPGKDSFRHREAGATAVGILAPGMTAVFRKATAERDAASRYDEILAFLADCDLVLVEGDVHTTAVKVEIWRAATDSLPLAYHDPSIHAVITDDSPEVSTQVWKRSDVAELVRRLLALAGVESRDR